MSVKKIHLFPSEESYVANSGSVDADDVALVPLNLATVRKPTSRKLGEVGQLGIEFGLMGGLSKGGTGLVVVVLLVNRSRIKIIPLW